MRRGALSRGAKKERPPSDGPCDGGGELLREGGEEKRLEGAPSKLLGDMLGPLTLGPGPLNDLMEGAEKPRIPPPEGGEKERPPPKLPPPKLPPPPKDRPPPNDPPPPKDRPPPDDPPPPKDRPPPKDPPPPDDLPPAESLPREWAP